MLQKIISHMNEHHKSELLGLVKRFANINECKEISLVGVDTRGLDISCDGQIIRINFPKEVLESELKNAIIELCSGISQNHQSNDIKQEILDFQHGFGSVIIASIDENHHAIASYAPLLRYQDRFFIYISQTAEHYQSIKQNPNAIEVLFLEDESKAKSIILRKRLKYKTKAIFREKDSEFEQIFDHFEASHPNSSGLSAIRKMGDFHLIELFFQEGRFVKGFGAAYDIDVEGNVQAVGSKEGNPHKISPMHKPANEEGF